MPTKGESKWCGSGSLGFEPSALPSFLCSEFGLVCFFSLVFNSVHVHLQAFEEYLGLRSTGNNGSSTFLPEGHIHHDDAYKFL